MSKSKPRSAASTQVRDAGSTRGSATTAEGIVSEQALLAARGRGRETSRVTRAAHRLERAARADARASA
jgi:hypothetical protein